MAAIIVILSILLLFAGVMLFIAYKYIRRLVTRGEELLDANQEYDEWIKKFAEDVNEIYDEMIELDASGAFRADDEIGHTFENMMELVEKLKTLV